MVNTRSTGTSSGQQGQNNQSTDQPLLMPPPLTPEQFFQLQMQMMATLNNTVQTLQQIQAQLLTSSIVAAPQQACGLSEGSPADILSCG
jgi:hypothetical protein